MNEHSSPSRPRRDPSHGRGSGIVLPDSATEKPILGEVLAVGPGKMLDNGEVRKLQVKVGDKVLFGKYAGTEVKLGLSDKEVLVMREDDLMGVVED